MGLINQDIKNLVSGVSQQPPILRHPEQLEEQLNGYSSESSGLQKRPPSMFVASLGRKVNDKTKPLVHFIDRDEDEKYIVLFTGSDIEVYDMQGRKQTVKFTEGTKPYIYSEAPRYTLKPITIADYTFVSNIKQVTKMADTIDNKAWETQGLLVNIKSGQYGRTYRIDVNGETIASYETPDGSDKSHTKLIATDYIANKLAEAVEVLDTDYKVVKGSSWLYIQKVGYKSITGETLKLHPSTSIPQQVDRFKGLMPTIRVYNYTVQTSVTSNKTQVIIDFPNISRYPAKWQTHITYDKTAYDAFFAEIERCKTDMWEVTTEVSSANQFHDIYTLTYTTKEVPKGETVPYSMIESATVYDGYNNQAAFGILKSVQKFSILPATAPNGFLVKIKGEEGSETDDYYVAYDEVEQVWKECARPSLKNHIDNTTMPHVLVREADGTFTFKCADWSARDIGDDDSNPEPSFIGDTINDVFYHRNRLGFLSGENVILTRSADFFNFWMTSATKVQDTDPIDLAASDSTISTLYNAVTFDTDLVLFSRNAQFLLTADGTLTPTSANLTPAVTRYEASLKAKPVSAGRNVYFAAERAKYTSIREFFTAADNTDAKDVQDITSHVPNYIPNGVYKIIPSTVENLMLYITEGDETAMYIYKYLFIDSQRVQAAWSKWDMQGAVYGGQFIDNNLYLIVNRNGYYVLERISFTINTTDLAYEPYRVLLDCKMGYEIPADDYDYNNDQTTVELIDVLSYLYDENEQYSAVMADGTYVPAKEGKLVFDGDVRGQVIIVGLNYLFKMVMSTIMVKQANNGSTQALTEGRLQLRQLWFNYADSGYFKVLVDIKDKQVFEYEYTSRLLGTRFNVLEAMPFTTGSFKVPVQAKNENVSISVETDTPLPVSFVGAGWIGNYQRRTRLF